MPIEFLNDDKQPLSAIIHHMKYARYLEDKKRRETWEETVERNKQMHLKKYSKNIQEFPELREDIEELYNKYVFTGKVLPSMRALQFGGRPIELNPVRQFNCSFLHVSDQVAFSEALFCLLSGTGVGYSVQKHHIEQLPPILGVQKDNIKRFLIGDSIEGWSDAVKVLIKSYFEGSEDVEFDFRDIRSKGTRLVTSGGKAPGPEPLRLALIQIKSIFENALQTRGFGTKLKPIEAHDLMCYLADAVLSGGIRRAAMISLFSFDDHEMLESKFGAFWELNPQRQRANNSAVILRDRITEDEFWNFWRKIEESKKGEPGIFFTNNRDLGTNPSLRAGTKVLTKSGIVPIEKLQDTSFEVPNLDGHWSYAQCWKSGENIRLWKLKFDNGVEYFSSPQHEWPVYNNGRYLKCQSNKLKPGDRMPINAFNRKELFEGTKGTYDIGFVIGWLYGDGSLTKRSDTGKYVASFVVSKKETEVLDILLNTINQIDGVSRKLYERNSVFEFQVGSPKFINLIMNEYGVNKKEKGIPANLWTQWNDTCIRGFIDGLFSADGHISADSHGINIVSSREKLVKDVQELLGFYGIKSNISHKSIRGGAFPNKKTYDKEYNSYVLRTTLSGRLKFHELFQLSVHHKQKNLSETKQIDKSTINQQFMILRSIEETNIHEDVWDISVKDSTHCFHLSTVTTGNCSEISLKDQEFCNLTEINASNIVSQEDLEGRVWAATLLGTLQAGYVNFHYLRSGWKKNGEKEALLGVSMTGVCSPIIETLDIKKASSLTKSINSKYAKMIGIKESRRITAIKPAGTTSLVLGTSSGIHAWHNDYYLRRVRVNKNEAIYVYLNMFYPELLEDDYFSPEKSAVITVPQKAPEGAVLRTESPIDTLERVKSFHRNWIKPGHRQGDNTHNVSCTISIKDEEWQTVGQWMWLNRDHYTGISVLPYDGGTYIQPPFEDLVDGYVFKLSNGEVIRNKASDDMLTVKFNGDEKTETKTVSELANNFSDYKLRSLKGSFEDINSIKYMTKKEQYEELVQKLKSVDVSFVPEEEDGTDLSGELACAGGACEVK